MHEIVTRTKKHFDPTLLISRNLLGTTYKVTALHMAVAAGQNEIVKLLLNFSVDVDQKEDMEKLRPLYLATKEGHTTIVNLLIDNAAEFHHTPLSKSLLHYAVEKGNVDVVKSVLAKDSEVDKLNKELEIPLHIAARSGYGEVVKFLLEKNADVSKQNKISQYRYLGTYHFKWSFSNVHILGILQALLSPLSSLFLERCYLHF